MPNCLFVCIREVSFTIIHFLSLTLLLIGFYKDSNCITLLNPYTQILIL